jgi:hypothetical protein
LYWLVRISVLSVLHVDHVDWVTSINVSVNNDSLWYVEFGELYFAIDWVWNCNCCASGTFSLGDGCGIAGSS